MKGFLYGQTEYNLSNNTIHVDDFFSYAKENNHDFISLTDPNLYYSYKFYNKALQLGMKPIIGFEYEYISLNQKYSSLLIYAKNKDGFKNLLKISSKKATQNIEALEDVLSYDNLIFIFVYNNSYLETLSNGNDKELFEEFLNKIKRCNGYIGYSYTNEINKISGNDKIIKIAKEHNIKCVPVHQSRYLKSEDKIIYNYLLKMAGKKEELDDFSDYSFLQNPDSNKELDDLINSIDVNDYFINEVKLPHFKNNKGVSSKEYLEALCYKGLERRGLKGSVYYKRLEYELGVINKMGYDDYFLIVWDFIRYSKQHDILVGPGRGSGAGSLIAYCLGITEVNPLQYDLLFERFLNPERVSMPDIDTDFPDDKRDMVIDYVRSVYGDDHVCSITTFGTYQIKSSVRELSKAFGIAQSRVSSIVDLIEKHGYEELLEQYKGSELYDFLYVAKGLENLPKHIGTHAAGIIISADKLDDIIPVQTGINNIVQAQYEAVDLEKLGLLKMDFLGIRNLTMLKSMMDQAGFDLDKLRHIPLNDSKVFKLFQESDTLGIFQFESVGIRKVLREMKPTSFDDLVAVIALYRPGPMDSIPEYIRRKHGGKFEFLHPDLIPILKSTYGIIIYQEQIMLIAQKFAGFSLAQADNLRRAISKKKVEILDSEKARFINGAKAKGYTEKLALDVYDLIYKFADYGFNKSHSVVYALLAYQMAYFKANYFEIFMSNILNNVIGDAGSTNEYLNYCKSHNLVVYKPNVNVSTDKYVYTNKMVFMPLKAINSIGDSQTSVIVEERNKHGLYTSYANFKERTNLSSASLEALIYSGALDIFGETKKSMMNASTQADDIFFKIVGGKKTTSDEFEFEHLRDMEFKYLKMNIEYNIYNDIDKYIPIYRAIPISRLEFNRPSRIVGAIKDYNIIKTKNGDEMLIGQFEDNKNVIKIIMFPKTYNELKNKDIKKNMLYVIAGRLNKDNRNENCFEINGLDLVEKK